MNSKDWFWFGLLKTAPAVLILLSFLGKVFLMVLFLVPLWFLSQPVKKSTTGVLSSEIKPMTGQRLALVYINLIVLVLLLDDVVLL